MTTIQHCVVLLSVLCGSSPVTRAAQDNIPSILVTNNDEEAIAKHRLTVAKVRKMFAVERELLTLMKDAPDLNRRAAELAMRIDPQRRMHSLAVETKVHEEIPEIAQILQRQKISAREYLLTKFVATGAEMSDESLKNEGVQREIEKDDMLKAAMMSQSLQFWRAMDPALKAEAAEWKRTREEMEKLGRGR